MNDATDQSSQQNVTTRVDFVALAAGQTIGRYEILSVLGQGGFGITYRAHDSQLDREVAIKEYLPLALAVRQDGTTVLPRSTDAAADFSWGRERFVAEGRTLASLQRAPAIVRVFDFLEANGTAYIVMELLSGQTLEGHIRQKGPLGPDEIDRILWPLLDGLEKVHATGFLHRDIKPANILLDEAGNPTLIDFGASRAAMAGRTAALTAIFTPGYAAAEQMTSAKQGPWTDIYGLSATLYHAITGQTPPSAFDRMLDDDYEPLGGMSLPGFPRGLLVGIDSGLAVRASDRPQSIAGWRPLLGQIAGPEGDATVALARPAGPTTGRPPGPVSQSSAAAPSVSPPVPAPARRGIGLWVAAAAGVVLALGGGYYALVDGKSSAVKTATPVPAAPVVDPAVEQARVARQAAEEAQRRKDQEELERLRAEAAAREKAAAEAAEKHKAEELERKSAEEAREKAAAEAAVKRKAEEEEKKAAEAAEIALRLTALDRQHAKVALTALGFDTGGTSSTFTPRTREMIAAWQKSQGVTPTGFLTGPQNQALLREAMPAVAKFDDEQRKAAEAQAKAATPPAPPVAAPPQTAAVAPPQPQPPAPLPSAAPAAAASRSGPDGAWRGTLHCTPSRNGGELNIPLLITLSGGSGTWVRPGSGPGTSGVQSISLHVNGSQVTVARAFIPNGQTGAVLTGKSSARFDGNTISGSGPEAGGGGRICTISLTRAS